jgi:uncharacterized protein YdcH (DUF465 family)
MTHTPHELQDEFPEFRARIHELKGSDSHFQRLSEEYHRLNREIHRIEAEIEAVSDEVAEDLKKKRLRLKDELFAMLQGASE